MWRYRMPSPDKYDSEEEYNEALATYEDALSRYEDEAIERYYEQKYDNYIFIQWMKSDY